SCSTYNPPRSILSPSPQWQNQGKLKDLCGSTTHGWISSQAAEHGQHLCCCWVTSEQIPARSLGQLCSTRSHSYLTIPTTWRRSTAPTTPRKIFINTGYSPYISLP